MSWIALFLGLILLLAGGAGLAASFDLLTTELGLLYATCGAIAFSGGIITIAIGLLIRRVDALRRALLDGSKAMAPERRDAAVPPLLAGIEPVAVPEPIEANLAIPEVAVALPDDAVEPAAVSHEAVRSEEASINETRKGYPPSREASARNASEPAPAPPSLVGRYSAGGANYAIFSDGSIEAKTDQGDYKFGSMSEFKAFIAAKRG
jgi:hypothetical protein